MKKSTKTKLLITGLLAQVITFFPGVSIGLSLDEAVALALENNPDLQKEQMNLSLSEEALSGKKAQKFGRFDLITTYGHYNNPRALIPLTPVAILDDPEAVFTTEDLFTTGITYEVPLFTGFAQQLSVEIAELERELAGVAIKLSREQLIYNVKVLYVNILSLQAQKVAQEEYHTALQRLHDDIVLEVKLGKKARVDQLKAAVNKENSRVKVRHISGDIEILKASLATLLNNDSIDELEDSPMEMQPLDGTEDDKDLRELDRYRSTVLDVEKNAKLEKKSAAGDYPQINFNGFYGLNYGPNDPSNANEGDWNNEDDWHVAINFKWAIFDFGTRKAAKRQAAIRKQQSQRDQLTTELELAESLHEAVIQIKQAVDDYHSAETELALTRETERIEQIRFEKGATDLNDLLYAKARNQLAVSRSITARYSYQSSRFYLDYLLENGENK